MTSSSTLLVTRQPLTGVIYGPPHQTVTEDGKRMTTHCNTILRRTNTKNIFNSSSKNMEQQLGEPCVQIGNYFFLLDELTKIVLK